MHLDPKNLKFILIFILSATNSTNQYPLTIDTAFNDYSILMMCAGR